MREENPHESLIGVIELLIEEYQNLVKYYAQRGVGSNHRLVRMQEMINVLLAVHKIISDVHPEFTGYYKIIGSTIKSAIHEEEVGEVIIHIHIRDKDNSAYLKLGYR